MNGALTSLSPSGIRVILCDAFFARLLGATDNRLSPCEHEFSDGAETLFYTCLQSFPLRALVDDLGVQTGYYVVDKITALSWYYQVEAPLSLLLFFHCILSESLEETWIRIFQPQRPIHHISFTTGPST